MLSEVARHFSLLFSEEVTAADVLRLGLDRKLPLSVNFVNCAEVVFGGSFVPVMFTPGQSMEIVPLMCRYFQFPKRTALAVCLMPGRLREDGRPGRHYCATPVTQAATGADSSWTGPIIPESRSGAFAA